MSGTAIMGFCQTKSVPWRSWKSGRQVVISFSNQKWVIWIKACKAYSESHKIKMVNQEPDTLYQNCCRGQAVDGLSILVMNVCRPSPGLEMLLWALRLLQCETDAGPFLCIFMVVTWVEVNLFPMPATFNLSWYTFLLT